MRNWQPFIKDALAELAAGGVTRVIGIPMAPQFSTLSVQKYIDAATAALPAGVQFEAVESFHAHPLLLDAFAERVRAAQPKPDELVVFTAHSLPARVIEAGDPYADEVAATARGVAERAGIARYDCAYQSAGRTPEPWIGPDLAQLIDDRAAAIRKFLVVPIGFVCDHTEILFDIDVQAARIAREVADDAAADRVAEHVAAVHRDARGSRPARGCERVPSCPLLTSSSSAAASPGSRRRTSCSRRGVSFVLLERAPRAGGVILSEEIDGFTIDAGPDALLMQKPEGIALCEELGLGDRLVPTKPPRLAYIQRGGRLHALPAASVLGIPTRIGPFLRTTLFSWPGKLRMGAELFVRREARRQRRIDRRVHDAPIRRRSGDVSRRAAAGRHSRRRRRSPVGAGAVSALRRCRAPARQPAARVPTPQSAIRSRHATARSSRCPAA